MKALVGVIMGSSSDWETLQHAADVLDKLSVPYEVRVVSAHRTPDLLFEYSSTARARGLEVIIAGAGGAAHLPGMTAANAALCAAAILANKHPSIAASLDAFRERQTSGVLGNPDPRTPPRP